MPTVLLVRHGRTAANASGVLAGWTPGIGLDETGQLQAKSLAERLAPVPLEAAVSSPLQRCQETAAAILAVRGPARRPRPVLSSDDRLGECHYGDWTGRALTDLAREPSWRVVQAYPSAVVFPGPEGEPMQSMQHRAVRAIREHDARVGREHGENAVWMAVSHADVIKAILADALGMHLDQFQRLVVDPCSISVVRYTPLRPFVVRVNDAGTDLGRLAPPPGRARRPPRAPGAVASEAVIGGGAGTGSSAPAPPGSVPPARSAAPSGAGPDPRPGGRAGRTGTT